MDCILLTLASVLLAADFALNKVYQKKYGTEPKVTLLFNSLLGLFSALIFFVMRLELNFSLFSCVLALLTSTLVMSYNIIGFKFLQFGNLATYTMFLMTGGMILPSIYGILFLNESPDFLRICAIIVIVFGVVLNCRGGKISKNQILMCVAVFVINGFVSIISKIHQSQTYFHTVNSFDFIIWGGFFKFLIAGTLFLFARKKSANTSTVSFKFAPVIICLSAVVGGVSYLMQLTGAKNLPATMLYPFITGGSVVFSSIVSVIVFKEKLTKKQILSILLCFAGTLLYL